MSQGKSAQPRASSPLLLDQYRHKYSWANGVARGTGASQRQYQKDLSKAFAEVDGLMAGFKYLDEIHPIQGVTGSSTSSPASATEVNAPQIRFAGVHEYATELSDDDMFGIEEHQGHDAPSEPRPDSSPQPMATQWAAIRSLRAEMEYHHQRFQTIPSLLDDPILSELHKTYKDSKGIRKTGVIVFRDVVDGFRPSKLTDIFAFASLSYSVSQLLYKDGRIEQIQILGGLRAWRDSITDRGERDAFNNLAQHLWPEAKDHLHFIPIQRRAPRVDIPMPMEPRGDPVTTSSTDLSRESFSNSTTNNTLNNHGSDHWLTFLDQIDPSQAPLGFLDQAIDITGLTREAWDFSQLQHLYEDPFSEQSQIRNAPPVGPQLEGDSHQPHFGSHSLIPELPLNNTGNGLGSRCDKDDPNTEDIQLRNTCVFLVVVAFLAEIQDLLHILSGSGLLSKPEKLYKAEEEEQKRFYKSIKEEFFEPRSCDGQLPHRNYNALLSVAKIFTRESYLRTAHDVKHYLVSVANAVFPPGKQWEQFVLWVMHNDPSNTMPLSPEMFQRKESRSMSKSRKLYTCNFPGCSKTCETSSGLNKHKREKHQRASLIHCPEGDYNNVRRDRVRHHFRTHHPDLRLPVALQGVQCRRSNSHRS
ncbi:hypothetical protein BJ170DRAFT_157111 [Xylariales sp. AK1849]|nr:hypothetical protein BJ170DRAFT_157111 [Xylariales sp. AK1849]